MTVVILLDIIFHMHWMTEGVEKYFHSFSLSILSIWEYMVICEEMACFPAARKHRWDLAFLHFLIFINSTKYNKRWHGTIWQHHYPLPCFTGEILYIGADRQKFSGFKKKRSILS
jgi:hypothetical protein